MNNKYQEIENILEEIRHENNQLLELCMFALIRDTKIYNKYLSNTPVGFMNYKELCNFFGIGDSNVKD